MKSIKQVVLIRFYEGEEELWNFLKEYAEKYDRPISYMIKLFIRDKKEYYKKKTEWEKVEYTPSNEPKMTKEEIDAFLADPIEDWLEKNRAEDN